jgi:hypothetical protein
MKEENSEDICEDCGGPLDEMSPEEEAAWDFGFDCGVDCHLTDMYEAAELKGDQYTKMLDELFEIIDLKYSTPNSE